MKVLILSVCVVFAIAAPSWKMLDDQEVSYVKSSWNSVKNNEVDLLAFIFKEYPEIQQRFPAFVNKDLATLKDTGKFATHATRIVGLFSEYIILLGQQDTQSAIKTVLNDLGQTHRNRGIPKDLFEKFQIATMKYLNAHATGYNADVEHAWNDAFDKMYYVIFSAMDGHPVA